MTTSLFGRKFIEMFEGFAPSAYQDQRGIWTIGYGHTSGVKQGHAVTMGEADQFMADDLKTAEDAINRLVKTGLTQNQFDALVSLVFNIGEGNFANSTVLRDLNALQYAGAAIAITFWNRTNGTVNPGLVRRREAEKALFLTVPKPEKTQGGKVTDAT